MFKILAKAKALESQGKSVIHFEIGEPDFESPSHVVEAAKLALDAGDTHYVQSMGIPDLRAAVQQVFQRDMGFTPETEQVLVTPGANGIIYYVIQSVVNPGEEVVVQDPGFPTYYSVMSFLQAKPVHIGLKEENGLRMNPDDVRRAITEKTRLVIMNSPQNPTGAVMRASEIDEIYEICREHDVYLLTDEIYGKMTYDEEHHSPAPLDQCKERVIHLNGVSKAYAMTGWRLGYAVGPTDVIDKMGLTLQTIESCVPPFIQRGAIAALLGDQGVIGTMMVQFRKRRDLIVKGLNDLPGVHCLTPGGAFYAFPNVAGTGMNGEEFADYMLEEAGVATCPGSFFGPSGTDFVRFSYATSLPEIEEAIGRMREALGKR